MTKMAGSGGPALQWLADIQCGDNLIAHALLHDHAVVTFVADLPLTVLLRQAVQNQWQGSGLEPDNRHFVLVGRGFEAEYSCGDRTRLLLYRFDKTAGITIQSDAVTQRIYIGVTAAQ